MKKEDMFQISNQQWIVMDFEWKKCRMEIMDTYHGHSSHGSIAHHDGLYRTMGYHVTIGFLVFHEPQTAPAAGCIHLPGRIPSQSGLRREVKRRGKPWFCALK